MVRKGASQSSIFRVLAAYAVVCFVILQLLDIVLEPLGLSVASLRWVMLLMIAIAPVLAVGAAWRSHQRRRDADTSDIPDQDAVFRIEHAELDTAQRQIRFAGEPVEVQPKVFDLIEYLVRARSRVVGKEELFDQIWPAVVVTEASLTQSIKRARDLFRRNGFETDVIRTVARKGYQFDGAVETTAAGLPDEPGLWGDIVLPTAGVTLAAIVLGFFIWNSNGEQPPHRLTSDASRSLVVLPFTNMTPDQDFGYFSDGLTETVTSSLTTVHDLRVIARGSAFSFRDADARYDAIGEELNVAHIVEGSVQRDDDELRISARLIRAVDGQQIWSEIYSRPFGDVFALQDDISRSIVAQMSALLSTQLAFAGTPASTETGAEDGEAYRLLLLGREQRRTSSAGSLALAESNFREALDLKPDFPEAMVALAQALSVRATFGELPREPAFAEALTLIRQALESNPRLGDAYLQLGEIQHRHLWDFDDAAESFTTALELNPGSALVHSAYSRFLSKSGKFEQAIQEAEVALDLDPRSARAATSLAIRQIRARRLEEARGVIDALAASSPDNADLPWLETNWHIRNGSYRDALQAIALEELDYLRLSLSAIALAYLDRTDQAGAALDELVATDPEGAAFQIAEVYAQWGDADGAFEWLERAYSQGDPGLAELYSSVNLENLYADPRFAALAGRVGLPPLDLI